MRCNDDILKNKRAEIAVIIFILKNQ